MITTIDDLIYESNTIRIYKDYCFEITNKITTYDYVEAISFLSKMIIKNDIWDLKLPYNFKDNIKPINSLYYLSGGDEFWIDSKYDWCEYMDLFENKFHSFKSDFDYCKTFKDIRNVIFTKFNLVIFY